MRGTRIAFHDLIGWADDDHEVAYAAFKRTAYLVPDVGERHGSAREFFEAAFQPTVFEDGDAPLFTGYYEPELSARLAPDAGFDGPIYAPPSDLSEDRIWLSRAQIEATDALKGQEIAWLRDKAEAFFLQVQGSGRLRLPDGTTMRVGFAGKNGHPYLSIGKELVQRGIAHPKLITADLVRDWIRANPAAGADLMRCNPSFVFFRTLELDPGLGPLGGAGVPVTAGRTIAVDVDHTRYGLPVWLEKDAPYPIRRLMVAQDTGSAIRGAQRADIFFGTGHTAGQQAGAVHETGRMIVFVPKGAA